MEQQKLQMEMKRLQKPKFQIEQLHFLCLRKCSCFYVQSKKIVKLFHLKLYFMIILEDRLDKDLFPLLQRKRLRQPFPVFKGREIARMLADQFKQPVVIVDTSNEIGGDGDVPHSEVGHARRMQVSNVNMQHNVMTEAVENHMPETIIIDEIGTENEALGQHDCSKGSSAGWNCTWGDHRQYNKKSITAASYWWHRECNTQ